MGVATTVVTVAVASSLSDIRPSSQRRLSSSRAAVPREMGPSVSSIKLCTGTNGLRRGGHKGQGLVFVGYSVHWTDLPLPLLLTVCVRSTPRELMGSRENEGPGTYQVSGLRVYLDSGMKAVVEDAAVAGEDPGEAWQT